MTEGLLFYMFGLILLGASVMTVTARNPVHAVLFMVLSFFNGAGIFLLLGAEFLAFILLIVYVGAIAVLFLFVVMMLGVQPDKTRSLLRKEKAVAFIVGGVLLAQILTAGWSLAGKSQAIAQNATIQTENTRRLGQVLYTDYFLPFQVSGLILLVAIIGTIVLTVGPRRFVKRQDFRGQIASDPRKVVELVHVETGKGAL